MSWPSKDPADYQHPPRPAPRFIVWLRSDSGVSYAAHFAAGAGGVVAVLALTADLLAALGGGLLAQALLEVTGRRPSA
jgi:hypothetical protein